MGLLDRASRGLSRAGDETVRVVDYDSVPQEPQEEKEPREKKAREPKPQREPKAPRKKLGLGAAAKGLLPHKEDEDEPEGPDALDLEEENGLLDDDLISMATSKDSILETPKTAPKQFVTASTAFEIDEDEPNFYEQKQQQWDSKAGPSPVEDLLPKDGAIQDVLDVLKIPATFTIREDVLMPDDFETLDFDIQVPKGYDIGQVQFFVERVETSVKEYLKLLEARNEHIAKLATTVDRLQVDANNLKYDSQIAAGIGIIPTSESVDLENENMELKLQLQKFKDAQKTTINSEERKLYEEMRNELSKSIRENEVLTEKNYELKSLVAQMEESADEMVTMPSNYTDHESAEIVFQNIDDEEDDSELPSIPGFETDGGLPDLSDSELPDFSLAESPAVPRTTNSSFDVDEDDVGSFLNSLKEEPQAEEPKTISYLDDDNDEDDDELDRLMKEWKN